MMYLPEAAVAVAITVLNVVIGASLGTSGPRTPYYLPLLPLITAACGFLTSMSKSALMILTETSYIVAVALMHPLPGLFASLLPLYALGTLVGLLKRKNHLDLRLRAPAGYYPVMLSLGLSLIGTGAIGIMGIPLETPVGTLIRRGISVETLLSAVIVYAAQAYVSSVVSEANMVMLSLASLLSPYTLPLLSTLPFADGIAQTHLRGRRLVLGRVVEVIKGARVGELAVPFERGLNRNVVIIGATGTGKSTLAKNLVDQIKGLGAPVVVFDAHGEYCYECDGCECVDASELSVDIFRVFEEDPKTRAEFVADAISEIYSLGNLQRIALSKALSQLYGTAHEGVGFDYLLEYLWRAYYGEVDLGVPQPVVRSLIPYLEKLKNALRTDGRRIVDYVDAVTVVDYSRLSSGVSAIIAEMVTDELYHTFKDLGRELILVVDEAHRFLRKGRALSRLFREGRKYGISSILVTQDVGSIPRELLLNTAALVSFSLPEVSVSRYIAKIVSPGDQALYERVVSRLTSLPQFYALASVPGVGSYIIETRRPYSTHRGRTGVSPGAH